MLAFWTGGDAARIDVLFRQGGLYREKWDRENYRNRTIAEALSGKTEFYKVPKTVKLADSTERKVEDLKPEEIGSCSPASSPKRFRGFGLLGSPSESWPSLTEIPGSGRAP